MFKFTVSSFALASLLISRPSWSEDINADIAVTQDVVTQQARGVLEAGQTAEIAAGMSGRLLSANYKPGQAFKSGALWITKI